MAENLQNWIGKTQHHTDVVTASLVQRYKAVIGQVTPQVGTPYGLHWCTCLPTAPMGALGQDGHPETGNFLPPSPLPRRMWAASDVTFLNSIEVGSKIDRQSTILNVTEKTGRSGSLLFVEVEHLTKANGVNAVSEKQTIVYREAPSQKGVLPTAIELDLSEWDAVEKLTPSTALLFRFSALTFNTHRIHYDDAYAREVEGYPGLVVHGPLMASLLLRFATQVLDGKAIKGFSFRGRSPAFCGQDIHLAAKANETGHELAVVGIDGQMVMSANVTI